MHWGSEHLGGSSSIGAPLAGVNALTTPARCPDSKQPELKHAAVKVLKAELPWSLLAQAWLPPDRALQAQAQLRALMPQFAFAVCVPFSSPSTLGDSANARDGVLLRCAAAEAPSDDLLAAIEQILGLDAAGVLRYADRRRGQRRAMVLAERNTELRLEAFLLAGDTRAQSWIQTVLQDQCDARAFGRQLLAPVARPPAAVAAQGKPVCTCFNVSQERIAATLADAAGTAAQRLDLLQQRLQCGTNCGSCVPELRRLAQAACGVVPAPLAA